MASLDKKGQERVRALVDELEEDGYAAVPYRFQDVDGNVIDLVATRDERRAASAKRLGEKFSVFRYDDLKKRPPLEWHIKGLLPKAELAVIYGEPGSGKSFLAFDLCCAIERGEPWGHSQMKVAKGRTVYVFAEGGAGARGRFDAYVQRNGDGPLPGAIIDAPNLLIESDPEALAERIQAEGGADVVVIDTLSASMPGGDENGGKDMGRAVDQAKYLHKETGALVVLIHHSGKDSSKGARGWSGLKAAADAELAVTRNGDYRQVEVSKLKDGQDGSRIGFRLNTVVVGIDEDGDEITSCCVEPIAATCRTSADKGPQGSYANAIRAAFRELAPDGSVVDNQRLIDLGIRDIAAPEDGKKDNRRAELRRKGIMKLVEAGELEFADEEARTVRRRGAIATEEFD